MIKHFLVALFCAIALATHAETISVKQAEAYAQRFFRQASRHPGDAGLQFVWNGEDVSTRTSASSPAFYVFNRGTNQGFVIISASKSTQPVLAYAYDGSFSAQRMPSNVKRWMQSMRETIRSIEDRQLPQSASVSKAWNQIASVAQEVDLLTPDWDQDDPYNRRCPALYGRHCYTGCAITATAIVMGYHQWPDKGTGVLPAYTTNENRIRISSVTLGEEYHWEKMPYINGNALDTSNPEQADAVAAIMYHTGVMAKADYSLVGTGARLENIATELSIYMKYHPQLNYKTRSQMTDEEWSALLRKEIDAKRPVIYEGYDETSGHAFVIDGYNSEGYFNVNWGWGGWNNGFYLLDRMTPGSGIGGSNSGSYNLAQGAIIGIQPRKDTEEDIDNLQYFYSQSFASGIEVEGMELPVKKGDSFWVDAGLVRNMGTNVVNAICKLAMTDHQGNIIQEFKTEEVKDLHPSQNVLITANKSLIEITEEVLPGYRLSIIYKTANSDKWKTVTCDESLGKWEIILNDGIPPKDNPIDESTTVDYELATGKITISTLAGVQATLKEKETGADKTSLLVRDGHTLTIQRNQLGTGAYLLRLEKGTDKKELVLRF